MLGRVTTSAKFHGQRERITFRPTVQGEHEPLHIVSAHASQLVLGPQQFDCSRPASFILHAHNRDQPQHAAVLPIVLPQLSSVLNTAAARRILYAH